MEQQQVADQYWYLYDTFEQTDYLTYCFNETTTTAATVYVNNTSGCYDSTVLAQYDPSASSFDQQSTAPAPPPPATTSVLDTQPSTSATRAQKRKRVLNETQRAEATKRERKRMFKLNEAFERLRQVLPMSDLTKSKLSRAETLKYAMEYMKSMIEHLSTSQPSHPLVNY